MPALPSLFIDRLAVTIPLSDYRQQDTREAASGSLHSWDEFIAWERPFNGNYRVRLTFTAPNGETATIFLDPKNSAHNYFKLEYSPHNLESEGRSLLGEYLREILGEDYLTDIREGDLRRLDVAFDVRRIRLKDLLLIDREGRKSCIYRGQDGEAETFYFPEKGSRQLCVYDKLREDESNNGVSPPNRKRASWVRFEYRYKSLNNYTLDNIRQKDNPFQDFDVRVFGMPEVPVRIAPGMLRMFFDACRTAGVEAVLAEIPNTATRDYLALAYENFPVPDFWLRRTSIWGTGFRRAIENALPR